MISIYKCSECGSKLSAHIIYNQYFLSCEKCRATCSSANGFDAAYEDLSKWLIKRKDIEEWRRQGIISFMA